ncbi:tetratricopeptide repeat protein [Candidatus Aminicenantes bacterium AC-334-E05]|nr:tetratricopeptide repeat protein [Candidatus Aminicenantes bacterium AC-334-E05]
MRGKRIYIIGGLLFTLIILLTACATFNTYYKLGYQASLNKDWDKAVKYFERALKEDPKNSVYRVALARAKIEACNYHLIEARRKARIGKKMKP